MSERKGVQPCMTREEEATFHRSLGQCARHFKEHLTKHAESLGLEPKSLPSQGRLVLVQPEVKQVLVAA